MNALDKRNTEFYIRQRKGHKLIIPKRIDRRTDQSRLIHTRPAPTSTISINFLCPFSVLYIFNQ